MCLSIYLELFRASVKAHIIAANLNVVGATEVDHKMDVEHIDAI